MPLWVLLELFSFGSFTDLYLFCARRWEDKGMEDEHYLLRQAKAVRNACAHSSAMVNGFASGDAAMETNRAVQRALAAAGFSHRVRTLKMHNPRIQQITTLLYLHSSTVTDGTSRARASRSLSELRDDLEGIAALMPKNEVVESSFGFLANVIDSWF